MVRGVVVLWDLGAGARVNGRERIMDTIYVKEWAAETDVPEGIEPLGWMGGWFNFKEGGKRWADYLEHTHPHSHPYLEAVRREVVLKGMRLTGEQHQESDQGVPVFSDGKALILSWRAWGDLMAAIWSEAEQKDYNYMNFYM